MRVLIFREIPVVTALNVQIASFRRRRIGGQFSRIIVPDTQNVLYLCKGFSAIDIQSMYLYNCSRSLCILSVFDSQVRSLVIGIYLLNNSVKYDVSALPCFHFVPLVTLGLINRSLFVVC